MLVMIICSMTFVHIQTHMSQQRFATFIREREEKEECSGLKLPALLITPIQRLPRYTLLLTQLLAYTSDDVEKRQLRGMTHICETVLVNVYRSHSPDWRH
jgi:hypothetical protein